MQMKRFAALASAAVICLSFAACGDKENDSSSAQTASVKAEESSDVSEAFDYDDYTDKLAAVMYSLVDEYCETNGVPADGTYTETSEDEIAKSVEGLSEYPTTYEIVIADGKLEKVSCTVKESDTLFHTAERSGLAEDHDHEESTSETSAADSAIEDYQAFADKTAQDIFRMACNVLNASDLSDETYDSGEYTEDTDSDISDFVNAMLKESGGSYVVTLENGEAVRAVYTITAPDGKEYTAEYVPE